MAATSIIVKILAAAMFAVIATAGYGVRADHGPGVADEKDAGERAVSCCLFIIF
ncbi:MAG: hypothetical protein WD076_12165 [Parvularculaceae bacterium]